MAAAVQQRQDGDIDRFIKDQRQKLQQERHVGGVSIDIVLRGSELIYRKYLFQILAV